MVGISAWGADVYYEKISGLSDIENNETYVIVISDGKNHYAVQQNSTNYVSVSFESDGRIKNPNSNIIWTAGTGSTTGTFKFKNGSNYIYCSGSNTTLNAASTTSSDWLVSSPATGVYKMNLESSTGRYIGWSGSKFAAYANSNYNGANANGTSLAQYHGALYIYKISAATEAFTVTFNAGTNGTCSTSSLDESAANAGVELPTCTPNAGYAFIGWSTANPATDKTLVTVGNDGKYHPTANTTLYALYKAIYTVTITTPENGTLVMKDGETLVTSGAQIIEGTVLTAEPTPNTGYIMRNWQAVDATTHTYTTSFTYTVNSDVTFKANFDPAPTYTINYMVNGVNTNPQEDVYEGTALSFPKPSAINGNNFMGWITDPSTIASPTFVKTADLKATQDITYYAVFAKEVTTTFDPNDLTNTPSTGSLTWTDSNTGVALTLSAGQLYTSGTPKTFTVTKGTSNYFQITSSNVITEIVTEISGTSYKINKTVTGATLSTDGTTQTITSSTLKNIKAYATSGNQIRATSIVVTTLGDYSLAPLGTASISVSAAGYSTYYNSAAAYVMPEGMEGYVWNDGLKLQYNEGNVVPAGVALVLKADEGNYTLNFTTGGDAPSFNDLEGTDDATDIANDEAYYFYALSKGKAGSANAGKVGFFFMNETGAAFHNSAHKAYLKLLKSAGAKSYIFDIFDEDTEDAIKAIDATSTEQVYDLAGRRVSKATKGIFIVNGKKVIR